MRIATVGIALALLTTGTPSAQGKPDFSGRWMPVSGPAESIRDGEVVITQTATTLTWESVDAADGRISMIFSLDGTESLNIMASVEIKSRASWEGDKLLIGHRNGPKTFETAIWFDTNRFLVIENRPEGERRVHKKR